jgi:hypothetical protein
LGVLERSIAQSFLRWHRCTSDLVKSVKWRNATVSLFPSRSTQGGSCLCVSVVLSTILHAAGHLQVTVTGIPASWALGNKIAARHQQPLASSITLQDYNANMDFIEVRWNVLIRNSWLLIWRDFFLFSGTTSTCTVVSHHGVLVTKVL